MSEELLRYHALLDGLGVDAGLGPELREAAAEVDAARVVLPTGATRTALRGPEEVPALTAGPPPVDDGDDVVDAELVEPDLTRELR